MAADKEPQDKADADVLLGRRVTELRKRHRLTLEQLAGASGVSRSMLSQIERGQANPTLAVTLRIAQAFGMTIGELVDQPWTTSSIEVLRGDDPGNLYRADKRCQIRTLSPLHRERKVEFYELRLAPGAKLESAPHYEGTKEMLSLYAGHGRVQSGETRSELSAGDSAYYRADLPHCIENVGEQELLGYLVVVTA